MQKKDVIDFFDSLAEDWDKNMIKSDEIIDKILAASKMTEGKSVLDVACGTGVMFDYYLERGAKSVTGIDISGKMAEIAQNKYKNNPKVKVVCADVTDYDFNEKFDLIVVYNAFPHFPEPEKLISVLASLLKEDGILTIAHGQSRKVIDSHHQGAAKKVSVGLMSETDLAKLFEPYFTITTVVSNDEMYQVSGKIKR